MEAERRGSGVWKPVRVGVASAVAVGETYSPRKRNMNFGICLAVMLRVIVPRAPSTLCRCPS
jgi:hypothetical protein